MYVHTDKNVIINLNKIDALHVRERLLHIFIVFDDFQSIAITALNILNSVRSTVETDY